MSDNNGDSGSRDRATVALVNAKLDEVKAIIEGHARTTEAQLEAIVRSAEGNHTRLEKMDGEVRALGMQVLALHSDLAQHKKEADERITEAEERGRFWRRAAPTLIIAAAAGAPGWIALLLH